MRAIHLPEVSNFTCQSCGRCCQGWSVPVDRATADRLRAHGWGADPFEPTPGASEPYRIKLLNGRCFFLDRENRCRIHTELSYADKPHVCRAFPLSVLEVGGERYARLSFWCPTVTANIGKPLAHQGRWLREVSNHLDHRTAPLKINASTELGSREVGLVHDALRRVVRYSPLPVGDRLAAASNLVRRLNAAAGGANESAVERVVRQAQAEGIPALAAEARGDDNHSGDGRRTLSLLFLQDRRDGRWAGLSRFLSVLMFSLGAARLRSRAVQGRASWRQLRRVAFDPSAEGVDLLTRYLSSKLDSRRYLAGETTLVEGVNLLIAAYAVINVLARMRAASEGRASCTADDIRRAVGAADLLVVEHSGLSESRLNRRLIKAALCRPELGRDLLVCVRNGR